MIEARVVLDSINQYGNRLTTFQLRYPKFIHGEFMTHRVVSRNASSSRAVPTSKLLEEVRTDALRAGPIFWGKNQKGMQAAEELDSRDRWSGAVYMPSEKTQAMMLWRKAALLAADLAHEMEQLGVHKQIVNRVLEPYSHINVVATATEWDNFFGLRLHTDAQPEMRALAIAMWRARQASTPKLLRPGEWHLPYIEDEDRKYAHDAVVGTINSHVGDSLVDETNVLLRKVSVARCGRVSYMSFSTGKRSTAEEDVELYGKLVGAQPLHASPSEHQGTPDARGIPEYADQLGGWMHQREHGNLVGWRQFRKMLPGEACAPIPEEFLNEG